MQLRKKCNGICQRRTAKKNTLDLVNLAIAIASSFNVIQIYAVQQNYFKVLLTKHDPEPLSQASVAPDHRRQAPSMAVPKQIGAGMYAILTKQQLYKLKKNGFLSLMDNANMTQHFCYDILK